MIEMEENTESQTEKKQQVYFVPKSVMDFWTSIGQEMMRINTGITAALAAQYSNMLQQIARQNALLLGELVRKPLLYGLGDWITGITKNFELIHQSMLAEAETELTLLNDHEYRTLPFMHAGFMTISEVRELSSEWNRGNKGKVKKYVLDLLKKEEIVKDIVESYKDDASFKRRTELIESALWAHRQGRYTLSVPLLYSILEGIIREKFKHLYEERERCKICNRPYYDTAIPLLNSVLSVLKADHAFVKVEKARVEYMKAGFLEDRNPILHGEKLDFDNEELSASLILALYGVAFIHLPEQAKERNSDTAKD